jgi:hypothetical protein
VPDITPEGVTLVMVLTGAGVTVSAALIAALVLILKRIPALGPAIDNDKEGFTSIVLAALLVVYAFIATTAHPDAFNGFAAFLAFVGIAGLASGAHTAAPDSVRMALSGKAAA